MENFPGILDTSTSAPVHTVEVFLVMLLDWLPLQLKGGRYQARVRQPELFAEGHGSRDLELFQPVLLSVVNQLPEDGAGDVAILAHVLEGHVGFAELFRQAFECRAIGAHQGDGIRVLGFSINADVLDHGAGFQAGFNLPKGYVLSVLELYEILLSVNDLERSVLLEFANVSRFEPSATIGFLEVFCGFLRHKVVPEKSDMPKIKEFFHGTKFD